MKLKTLYFALIGTMGWSFHMSAFCSFRLFRAPNGKLVLVIGDLHDKEARFGEHVSSFIDMISSEKLAQPLEILAELPEHSIDDLEGAPSFVRLSALKKEVESRRASSLRFICCDPRGSISEHLALLRQELTRMILKVVTQGDYEKVFGPGLPYAEETESWSALRARELSRLQRKYMDLRLTLSVPTLKAFLESLDKNLKTLEGILERYRKDEKVYELFKQYRVRYVEACDTLREVFGEVFDDCSPQTDLCFILEKLHLTAETTEDLLNTFIVFDACLLDSIDNLYATAVMLDHVLQRSTTQAPICVIAGETHALEIAQSLSFLQWECLDEGVLYQKVTPVHHNIKNDPDFDVRFKQALAQVLESLRVPARVCATCHTAQKKLVRCARCKETMYCDVTCQRKDWPTHQERCQKIKMLV